MQKWNTITLLLMLIIFALVGCTNTQENTLRIAAAASLRAPLEEIKEEYLLQYSKPSIEIIYGASGTLSRQITNGAPIDVFLSASEEHMKELLEKQAMDEATVAVFAKNQLVVIKPMGHSIFLKDLHELEEVPLDKIAIGEPSIVPAGKYAKDALTHLGSWEALEHKFVFAKDVTQVLTYVESGNVDLGFIYKSDLVNAKKAEFLYLVPENLHEPIRYLAGRVRSSKHTDASERFLQFLQTQKAQEILQKYDFTPIK